MKKMKKVLAMMLSLAMVFAMYLTAFAKNGTPEATDRATVSITGIGEGAIVNLYQIAVGKYGENGAAGFIDYEWVIGTKFEDVNSPTADEINAIAQGIANRSLRLTPVEGATKLIGEDGKYEYSALAGAYIAIITSAANDDSIYNPILLTASYVADGNEAGNLEGHEVDANEVYLGTTAVAKKTTPDVDKEIVGGTVTDPKDKDRETASVGDVITYQITPTMPNYPANATNKTLTFTDTMSEGLTFVFESLQMGFAEDASKVIEPTIEEDKNTIIFKCDDKEIAKAFRVSNGFSIGFIYDNLVHAEQALEDDVDDMMLLTAGVYTPVIRYNAVLNDKAVVGLGDEDNPGNPNDAKMYYSNKPNTGSTFEPTKEDPEPNEGELEGIKEKEDKETVYTYQLAFLKTGEGDDAEKLAGAVFGIYKDANCETLIDVVKTNDNGYAVSSKVEAGTYYIKELLAPPGYQLNDKVYSIVANKTSASTTITTETMKWKHTTEKPNDDSIQIGWIDVSKTPNVFYELGAYDGSAQKDDETGDGMAIGEMPAGTELMPAYAVYDKTSVTTTTEITEENDGGTASKLIDTTLKEGDEGYNPGSIPNTKLASLPSTGGIGTTIFTIGGCIIMIIAAGLFFASRRKKAEN